MEPANLVHLVQELSITTNVAQTLANLMKSREKMELVVSAHYIIGCHQIEANASRTSAMADRKFSVMAPVNIVISTPELTALKFIHVLQMFVLIDRGFFQMEHVKSVHHTPEASKEPFADLMLAQAEK